MRHGYGIFYYANGTKYEGEWKENLKEGFAIFLKDNGNYLFGIFKNDKIVKKEKQTLNETLKHPKSITKEISEKKPEPKNVKKEKAKKNLESTIKEDVKDGFEIQQKFFILIFFNFYLLNFEKLFFFIII